MTIRKRIIALRREFFGEEQEQEEKHDDLLMFIEVLEELIELVRANEKHEHTIL